MCPSRKMHALAELMLLHAAWSSLCMPCIRDLQAVQSESMRNNAGLGLCRRSAAEDDAMHMCLFHLQIFRKSAYSDSIVASQVRMSYLGCYW